MEREVGLGAENSEKNGSGGRVVLGTRGVSKSFGAMQALNNVDFEVRPGEVVALTGVLEDRGRSDRPAPRGHRVQGRPDGRRLPEVRRRAPQKQAKTGLTIVTRENIEQPDIEKYLYKAEC